MATQDNTFSITIDSFDGLAPAYYSNDWSIYGNKGSANNAIDVDISDPSVLTQGSGTTYDPKLVVTYTVETFIPQIIMM